MESEDLSTRSVDVARLWQAAYGELVTMEEQLLGQLEAMLPKLSPAARCKAELTNLPMINDHLQTFKYRRAHWPQRVAELDGRGTHRAQNRDLGALRTGRPSSTYNLVAARELLTATRVEPARPSPLSGSSTHFALESALGAGRFRTEVPGGDCDGKR